MARAGTLLARHGVVTREAVLGDGVSGGFAAMYPVLRQMEESGRVRRGYFIEGLGGSQFAVPGAVDRLRAARSPDNAVVLLASADPANPYGITVPWPDLGGRPARVAGAYVVLAAGGLRLYLERGGRSLLTHGEVGAEAVSLLHIVAIRRGRVELHTVDGKPVETSRVVPLLRSQGFVPSPRGLVLYPRRDALWSR